MKKRYSKPSYSQWWEQNSLRDRIEMQVLSANYSMENLLDELDTISSYVTSFTISRLN